jgi:hypothetical protein
MSKQIFSRDDFQALANAERTLTDMLAKLDDAEACGANCAVIRQGVEEMLRRFSEIKARFMTPAPKR